MVLPFGIVAATIANKTAQGLSAGHFTITLTTHTHTRTHARTHTRTHTHTSDAAIGAAVKRLFRNSYSTVASWGQPLKRRKNQSGGVFEANGSKQMGQRKKTFFHQIFWCLHEGWQRFGWQMWIAIVLLEYTIQGDRTGKELKQIIEILY